jgi:hypothetical protein
MNLGRTIKPITFCYSAVNNIFEKCYSALHLNESRPHDREWTLWIACYNTLSAVTGATTEDPDQPLPRHCCCCCMPLGTGPLNLGTVAIVHWIWIPLHRPIEIWQVRSNVCYSIVNLLQYYEHYFATALYISVDVSHTIKNERLGSIAAVLSLHLRGKCRRTGRMPLAGLASVWAKINLCCHSR